VLTQTNTILDNKIDGVLTLPQDEEKRVLNYADLVQITNPGFPTGLKEKDSGYSFENIHIFVGNIPSRIIADDISDLITSNWAGTKTKPTRQDFVNILAYKTSKFDQPCIDRIKDHYHFVMFRVAHTNSLRDFGVANFGLPNNCDRAEVVDAFNSIIATKPGLEPPMGISIGNNKEKGTKFGTVVWLGIRNFP